VLRIGQDVYAAIVAHARRDHPDEACGVVTGPAGSDSAINVRPMLNAARSPTFFEFESQELLALYRDVDDRDEDIVVIYHSHTATEAYPSRTDITFGSNSPDSHWVLVSTRDPETVEFRSFRIVGGEVTEEPVEVTGPESGSPG
jgi:[CysO sulfur-carrier protein]-S-L-cysteine hydrolase